MVRAGRFVCLQARYDQSNLEPKQLLEWWVNAHFAAPFPTPKEKDMLADITGMTRTQVPFRPSTSDTFPLHVDQCASNASKLS